MTVDGRVYLSFFNLPTLAMLPLVTLFSPRQPARPFFHMLTYLICSVPSVRGSR